MTIFQTNIIVAVSERYRSPRRAIVAVIAVLIATPRAPPYLISRNAVKFQNPARAEASAFRVTPAPRAAVFNIHSRNAWVSTADFYRDRFPPTASRAIDPLRGKGNQQFSNNSACDITLLNSPRGVSRLADRFLVDS